MDRFPNNNNNNNNNNKIKATRKDWANILLIQLLMTDAPHGKKAEFGHEVRTINFFHF